MSLAKSVLVATVASACAFSPSAAPGMMRPAASSSASPAIMQFGNFGRGNAVAEKKGARLNTKMMKGKVVSTKGAKGKGGKEPEEEDESKKLLQQIKDAGSAGIISYVFWEWAFWGVSIPVCIAGYQAATGHWPDFSNQEDLSQLGAEAFAFVNVARFAVPLRIGLALSTTPWVQSNIVDKFGKKDE